MFSVALSVEYSHPFAKSAKGWGTLPDVIRHTALRSSDFPLPAPEDAGSGRPVRLPTLSLYGMCSGNRPGGREIIPSLRRLVMAQFEKIRIRARLEGIHAEAGNYCEGSKDSSSHARYADAGYLPVGRYHRNRQVRYLSTKA